ncbi:MAG: VOC family protein [Myxococcota bacterium]
MSDSNGRFVWYELMTTDVEAAKAFYGKVVGWSVTEMPMPGVEGMKYAMFGMGEKPQHGLMALPEEARKMGAPPHWMAYVEVPDVDAGAEKVKRLGGQVFVPPMDIPNVGRFSTVADPTDAAISLFHSANPQQDAPPAMGEPGRVGWNELHTKGWEKAFAFYAEIFGWKKHDAMDMGPMGTYQLFGLDQAFGGMFDSPAPATFWLYYFNVGNIDDAARRVTDAGGQILHGPVEVPGGGWIVQCMDPQGAGFALLGNKG